MLHSQTALANMNGGNNGNSVEQKQNLLAFDADGVLIDYHHSYALAYERAFGTPMPVADPLAYWPKDRYGIPHLDGKRLARFKAQFHDELWGGMRALPGAVEALLSLRTAGFELVCVTAIRPEHRAARARNLLELGFPIDDVRSCHGTSHKVSPKAEALNRLRPAAFADDFLPYLRGVDPCIHGALIDRSPNGSPNSGPERHLARSAHPDVADFARFWLGQTSS